MHFFSYFCSKMPHRQYRTIRAGGCMLLDISAMRHTDTVYKHPVHHTLSVVSPSICLTPHPTPIL